MINQSQSNLNRAGSVRVGLLLPLPGSGYTAIPMGNWHNWLSRWARRWNIKVNPIQLPEQMPLPVLSKVCIAIKFYILPSAPTQAAVALNSIRENRFGSSAFSMYCAVLLNVSVQVLRKDYKSCVRSALVSQFS